MKETFKGRNSRNLIKQWPGTAESKKAAEIIAYLNQKSPELKVKR